MTKKLQDTLNLPDNENDFVEFIKSVENNNKELLTLEPVGSVSEIKRDDLLDEVFDITQHENEMDELANECLDHAKDLVEYGKDIKDMAAGKIFEASVNFYKIALEAKNNKAQVKLKAMDLALKKKKLELDKKEQESEIENIGDDDFIKTVMNRNDILEKIKQEKSKK